MAFTAEMREGLNRLIAKHPQGQDHDGDRVPQSHRRMGFSARTSLTLLLTLGVASATLGEVYVLSRFLQNGSSASEPAPAQPNKEITLETINCPRTTCFKELCPDPDPSRNDLRKYSQECQDYYHKSYPG